MLNRIDDKEYVLRLIQDLRVKLRDEEDFLKRKKLQKIIRKFEIGFQEEYEV